MYPYVEDRRRERWCLMLGPINESDCACCEDYNVSFRSWTSVSEMSVERPDRGIDKHLAD